MIVREFEINIYTLLYLKQITSKVVLYSTGKRSAQYHVATWMGGEFVGERIHIHIWLGHSTVSLELSQHCRSATHQCKIKSYKRKKENPAEGILGKSPVAQVNPLQRSIKSRSLWAEHKEQGQE